MTPIHEHLTRLGAVMTPHLATEPVPGDGSVVVVPTDTWRSVDDLLTGPRTDTTSVVLVAPGLQREGLVPNVIATTGVITPAVPATGLFDAVEVCMEGAEGWRVRARTATEDDEGRTLDLLGQYRVGRYDLALSSLVRVRGVGGVTVLRQTYVTTFADQISEHLAALDAVQTSGMQART